jgi:hypothetical protein
MLGAGAAAALPRKARIAVLAGMAGLTAASEVVSFTRVIERTPPLRWLDMLGRRPAATSAPGPDQPGTGKAPEASGTQGTDGTGEVSEAHQAPVSAPAAAAPQ